MAKAFKQDTFHAAPKTTQNPRDVYLECVILLCRYFSRHNLQIIEEKYLYRALCKKEGRCVVALLTTEQIPAFIAWAKFQRYIVELSCERYALLQKAYEIKPSAPRAA